VTFSNRGFWTWDDALAVWLAYLVEEIDRHSDDDDGWLTEMANAWRVAAAIPDLGAHVKTGTPEQLAALRLIVEAARKRAVEAGDLAIEDLRNWVIVDDLAVSQGFSRTGNQVELKRVLEVADASRSLLNGTLPPDPPEGAWFVGVGQGYVVMPYRERPGPGDRSGSTPG
jgi:hypothetical protein